MISGNKKLCVKLKNERMGVKMNRRKVVIVAITVIFIIGISIAGKKIFLAGFKKNIQVSAVNKVVKTQKVEEGTTGTKAVFKASLEAVDEGAITNQIGEKVIQVLFENGQDVSQGQTLVKLDDTDIRNSIATAEAQVDSAEAQLKSAENQITAAELTVQKAQDSYDTAQRDYNREKTLYEQGVVAKTDYENAETT